MGEEISVYLESFNVGEMMLWGFLFWFEIDCFIIVVWIFDNSYCVCEIIVEFNSEVVWVIGLIMILFYVDVLNVGVIDCVVVELVIVLGYVIDF